MTFFKMSDSNSIGTAYRMALESKNKDCLILYPYFEVIKKMHHVSMGSMTYGEVEAALGFPDINKRKLDIVNGRIMMQGTVESNRANKIMKLDSTKYVKMITGNDMKEYFNADTVYIYKVSLPEDYTFLNTLSKCHKVKYNRCIGINVTKTGRSSAMMKILFTEEGEQKEDEYIQLLLKSVRYSDVAPECNEVKTE